MTMTRRYFPLAWSAQWASAQHVHSIVPQVNGEVFAPNDGYSHWWETWCTSDSMCPSPSEHCLGGKCRRSPEYNQPASLTCKAKMTITPSTGAASRECVFPFMVNGHWFNECTMSSPSPQFTSLPNDIYWCATGVDESGAPIDDNYIGVCDCFKEEDDPCGAFVTTSGADCKPWLENVVAGDGDTGEIMFHRCQSDDSRAYCATEVSNGYEAGWDYCACQCTKDHDCGVHERCNNGKCEEMPCRANQDEDGNKCIYPFKINAESDWLYTCTRADGDWHMWCAIEVNSEGAYYDEGGVKTGLGGWCDCGTCDENLRGWQDKDYRGCQDHTLNGKKCQKWMSQYPHYTDCYSTDSTKHDVEGLTEDCWSETGMGDHNYCRNPTYSLVMSEDESTIWCHTTDPDVEWDWCTPKTDTFVGDPIITVNGHKTKVDLPHGLKTLMWKDATVEIFSKADVMTPDGKNQWFSQFSVKVNGEEALQIAVNSRHGVPDKTPDAELKKMLIASKGKSLAKPGQYDLGHNVVVEVTRKGQEEVVSVVSDGFSFSLASAQAKKFLPNVEKAKRYTHLDLQISNMDDKVVKDGILAELYGFIPISLTTAGMISHISSMH